MLNGAMVLMAAIILVKIIGALFKMPMTSMIGITGRGYFNSAYEIYTPIFAIAMAGLPVAVSKMVAESVALGRLRQAETDILGVQEAVSYRRNTGHADSAYNRVSLREMDCQYQESSRDTLRRSVDFLLLLYVGLPRILRRTPQYGADRHFTGYRSARKTLNRSCAD